MKQGDKGFFIWIFTFLIISVIGSISTMNFYALQGYLLAIIGFYAALFNHWQILKLLNELNRNN